MPPILDLLIVEDNKADRVLLAECMAGCPTVRVHFTNDGIEALQFLRREGRHTGRPRPHALLADLNLPRKNGRQLLAEMKGDASLKDIPVVIMSTSNSPDDRSQSYALGAVRYAVKPNDFQKYVELVEELVSYFTKLPTVTG